MPWKITCEEKIEKLSKINIVDKLGGKVRSPCKEFCRCIKAKIGLISKFMGDPQSVHPVGLFSRRAHHPLVSRLVHQRFKPFLFSPAAPSNSLMPALTWNLVSGQVSFRLSAGPPDPAGLSLSTIFREGICKFFQLILLRKAFLWVSAFGKVWTSRGPPFEGWLADTSLLLTLLQKQEGG